MKTKISVFCMLSSTMLCNLTPAQKKLAVGLGGQCGAAKDENGVCVSCESDTCDPAVMAMLNSIVILQNIPENKHRQIESDRHRFFHLLGFNRAHWDSYHYQTAYEFLSGARVVLLSSGVVLPLILIKQLLDLPAPKADSTKLNLQPLPADDVWGGEDFNFKTEKERQIILKQAAFERNQQPST